jgi:hypothetical protein
MSAPQMSPPQTGSPASSTGPNSTPPTSIYTAQNSLRKAGELPAMARSNYFRAKK